MRGGFTMWKEYRSTYVLREGPPGYGQLVAVEERSIQHSVPTNPWRPLLWIRSRRFLLQPSISGETRGRDERCSLIFFPIQLPPAPLGNRLSRGGDFCVDTSCNPRGEENGNSPFHTNHHLCFLFRLSAGGRRFLLGTLLDITGVCLFRPARYHPGAGLG